MTDRPRPRIRVTIVDVAARAGVHISTASRALNPQARHRISDEVVRRIERVARQLGYQPNPLASSLRTRRTGVVGLVVPNLSDPLFAPIIAAAQDRLAERGFITLVASSDYKGDKLLSIIELLARQHVAGALVASFDLHDPAAVRALELGVRTVAVLRDPRHTAIPTIAMDDRRGVAALVAHVLALGHRRVAYITAPLAASTAENRLGGFRAGAKRAAPRDCRFDVIEAAAYDVAEGERVMRALLADGLRWTAILCFNDLLAVGALIALREAGIACPGAVSVTGVNDLPFMNLLSPPLTSLPNAGRELGTRGAEMLLELIERPDEPAQHVLLACEPILRGSTGPITPAKPPHRSPSVTRHSRKVTSP